jgi:CHASE2 domain-containing sensor protein
MYWMSSSAGRGQADLAAALTFAVFCYAFWPFLGRIHQWKMRQQNKVWLSIALVLACLCIVQLFSCIFLNCSPELVISRHMSTHAGVHQPIHVAINT